MLQENLYPPTFKDRATQKLRRLWMAGINKVTPKSATAKGHFVNAAAWCIHGEIATRVVFFNYFWRNHHEETIKLDIQLIYTEGRELWRASKLVSQDQTLIIDSADIATSIGLAQFEGSLAFSSTMKKVPEFIELIRFNVDYYNAAGTISTVHDQAIFAPAYPPSAHSLGKMEVVETRDIGTALIFTNSLSYQNTAVSARVDVKAEDGRSKPIGHFAIKPRGMRRIELGRECSELEQFLAGKSGQVVVESDSYIKRAAVVQYWKAGFARWYSVNHSEEYRGNPPYVMRTMSEAAHASQNGPMAPMPFFHNYCGMTTDFVVFHDVADAGPRQVYGIRLFDSNGRVVFQDDSVFTVSLHGTARLSLGNYLPKDREFFGLAQIFLAKSPHNERWATSFPVDAHYILGDNSWDSMYSQGSYKSINAGEGSRTRVFSRAYCDDLFKTDVVLFYSSSASSDNVQMPESSTQVTICDPAGKIAITREVRLKPLTTQVLDLSKLFPETKMFGLKPGSACGVYIRDAAAKIIAVHMTRDSENKSIATDHFYGG